MPAREESGEPADASAGGKRKEAYGLADACAGKTQPDGKNLGKKNTPADTSAGRIRLKKKFFRVADLHENILA